MEKGFVGNATNQESAKSQRSPDWHDIKRQWDDKVDCGLLQPATEELAPVAGGILQILVGVVAIVFGFIADEFYTGFMRRPRPDEKPMAKWLGRTISVAVGIAFILSGLSDLRHH